MEFLSIEPFVPSGNDLEKSKQLFLDLGFNIKWDAGDYIGFEKDACTFILQRYNNKEFAENLMINVRINSADEFYDSLTDKKLADKFGVKIGKPVLQPYGKEVIVIDIAGVCWHFVE